MSSRRYFASPFSRGDYTNSHLTATSKRRRQHDDSSDDRDDDGPESPTEPPQSSYFAQANLHPDVARQYRVAGLPFDEEVPQAGFPHRPVRPSSASRPVLSVSELQAQFEDLNPPLYSGRTAPSSTKKSDHGNLRQQHIAVVAAIMHKCLLKGDYVRAGRAWGMLLRVEVDGYPMDIRSNGLWSLGAEILLRRDAETTTQQAEEGPGSSHSVPTKFHFTPPRFERAKEYYDHLILTYPTRKWLHKLSSIDFYPVMYGLWISFVQGQYQAGLAAVVKATEYEEEKSVGDSSTDQILAGQVVVRTKALDEAQEIADHMDQLLTSLPYLDDPVLWRIKGMISSWAEGLSVSERLPETQERTDDSEQN